MVRRRGFGRYFRCWTAPFPGEYLPCIQLLSSPFLTLESPRVGLTLLCIPGYWAMVSQGNWSSRGLCPSHPSPSCQIWFSASYLFQRKIDPSQTGSTCENKPCSPTPLTEDAKCFQICAMKKNDNAPAPANGKGGCTLPRTPEPIKVESGADQVLFLSALGDVCDRKETGSLIPFSGEWWCCFPLLPPIFPHHFLTVTTPDT